MRIMGIELQASHLHYVVIARVDDRVTIEANGRITLHATRDRDEVRNFQATLLTVIEDAAPERIAIKLKPETGPRGIAAGPAALKMEALVLVNSPCEIKFVSGVLINKVEPVDNSLRQYLQAALCTALAAA